MLTLAAAILTGGLFPQVIVSSRHNAAQEILKECRAANSATDSPEQGEQADFKWWPGEVATTKSDRR